MSVCSVHKNLLTEPPVFDSLLQELEVGGYLENMAIVRQDKPILSKKTGSFVGLPDDHGGLPYIHCPSFFESRPIPSCLTFLFQELQSLYNVHYNSIKIQRYLLGKSGIHPHSDKLLDLQPGKSIFLYRVHKDDRPRSIYFQHKTNPDDSFSIPLKSNDLLEIPWSCNLQYTHCVPEHEEGGTEDCLSFVLRDIHTFMIPETKMKYGGGARFSSYEERMQHPGIEPIDMRDPCRIGEVVKMYHAENTLDMNQDLFDYSKVRYTTV